MPPRSHRAVSALSPLFAALLFAALFPAAPARADVLTVYGDALAPSFEDWSWAAHDMASTTTPHGGTTCISMTATGWTGLYFHTNSTLGFSRYDSLEVWVRGTQANELVQFTLERSGAVLATVALPSYVAGGTIGTSWVKAVVPLRPISTDTTFNELVFQAATSGSEGTLYFDDIRLFGGSASSGVTMDTVTVAVDPRLDRRTVSPLVYGVNFADSAQMATMHYPVNRWGGNSTTRYSWQLDADNRGSDWFFMNIAANTRWPAALPNGSSADLFVSHTRLGGGAPLMTVPMIGWGPKDRVKRWSYSVAKYGAQQQTECTATNNASWCNADAGNGVSAANGQNITNDPTDASAPVGTSSATSWLAHLAAQFGHAGAGGVRYYALDNEPALWNSTHRDVHPAGVTYDELWTKTLDYATAIKTAEPGATVFGPAAWGWCEYFFSGADGCSAGSDAAAHGGTPLLEWYLQQVRARQLATGVRPVDMLDVHYYPQAGSVYSGYETDVSLRLRSLKSLYDPAYTDESWIGQPVRLIPRMKEIIAARCPGLGLALTEYSFGDAANGISCALAQAEALAIFGREGVDLATRWVAPPSGSRLEDAFRMYLNYDGAGANVNGKSVCATSGNKDRVGAYAVQAGTGRLFVLLFNKEANALDARVTLADGVTGPVSLYRFTSANALAAAGSASFSSGRLDLALPAFSATLAVVERTPPTDVPVAGPASDAPGLQLAVRANPMRGAGQVSFVMPRDGRATLTIHDVAGRRVRTLRDGETTAGPQSVTWDGTDDAGRMLPAGVYACHLNAAGRAETRMVVRLR